LIAISKNFRSYFNKHPDNSIEFWDCPSNDKWLLHVLVDYDIKKFNIYPLYLCKILQDFSKKKEYNNYIKNWQMFFQASDFKGKHFLELLDDELNTIELSYIQEDSWIKHFRHSNLLCTRAIRAINNYTPIGKYHLRFFFKKDFSCPCSLYPIETKCHILHNCRKFNNY